MTGSDHVEAVELAKAAAEDMPETIRLILVGATASVASAHGRAREHYGASVHGVSVNEPLVDLYRELDEAARALANARNALAVLTGQRAAVPPEAPAKRDVGAPPPMPRRPA